MGNDLLNKEEALDIYRKLSLVREAEEKIREEYFNDEMKTPVHLGIGGEAISVGVCHCLPKGSKTFGTYRNHALYLAMTENTDQFFGEMYGKVTGIAKGKAGSMHLSSPDDGFIATSAVVGTTIPLAVGAALANQYKKSNEIVAVFFGDGAVEEGVFWESLNFASLRKLRILFVCEDNDLAIHSLSKDRRGFSSLEKVAEAFDCHIGSADGSDMMEVIRTTRSVVRKITERPKPGLLRFSYFRFLEHVGPQEDFKFNYRAKPSERELLQRDPLLRFKKILCTDGCSPQELKEIQTRNRERVNESVRKAKEAPFAAPQELYEDVYA